VPFLDNVAKYGTDRQATDDNIIRHRKDAICMPDAHTHHTHTHITHTHTHTHTHTPHTHTHTHTHHTHAHMHNV
jgi:hypothetical protein